MSFPPGPNYCVLKPQNKWLWYISQILQAGCVRNSSTHFDKPYYTQRAKCCLNSHKSLQKKWLNHYVILSSLKPFAFKENNIYRNYLPFQQTYDSWEVTLSFPHLQPLCVIHRTNDDMLVTFTLFGPSLLKENDLVLECWSSTNLEIYSR